MRDAPDHALHIMRCNSIHTIGMRFALNCVWLAKDGRVVRVDENIAPAEVQALSRRATVIENARGPGEIRRRVVGAESWR